MSPFGLKYSQMILHAETSKLMYNWSFLFEVLHKPTLLPSSFNTKISAVHLSIIVCKWTRYLAKWSPKSCTITCWHHQNYDFLIILFLYKSEMDSGFSLFVWNCTTQYFINTTPKSSQTKALINPCLMQHNFIMPTGMRNELIIHNTGFQVHPDEKGQTFFEKEGKK